MGKDETDNRTALSPPNVEPVAGDAPLGTDALKALNPPVNITVTSYRKSRHDTDGISVKAVLDGLVAEGILRDDSTKEVASVTFKSEKAEGEEKTIIEIEEV